MSIYNTILDKQVLCSSSIAILSFDYYRFRELYTISSLCNLFSQNCYSHFLSCIQCCHIFSGCLYSVAYGFMFNYKELSKKGSFRTTVPGSFQPRSITIYNLI